MHDVMMIEVNQTVDRTEGNEQRSNDEDDQTAPTQVLGSVVPVSGRQPSPSPPQQPLQIFTGPYDSDGISKEDLNGIVNMIALCLNRIVIAFETFRTNICCEFRTRLPDNDVRGQAVFWRCVTLCCVIHRLDV